MRCKVIIDLNAIKQNIEKIKKMFPVEKIMAVVKANAYGHGYENVTKLCNSLGIKWFAVATYEEAIELWDMKLNINILILGPVETKNYKDLEKKGIHFTVTSYEELEYINSNCKNALYHLAYDTGMGRIGFNEFEIENVLKKYNPIGMFTHLSVAEKDEEYTINQIKKFNDIAFKYDIKYRHALNSYGSLNKKTTYNYDLYRIGIIMYGADNTGLFKQAMSLYARISYVKVLKNDSFIGYGNTYKAKKGDVIATVSIGYADGLSRIISNKGKVYCNGNYYPIIGNICMDQMMIKVDEKVKVGDFVEIFGPHLPITDVAKICDTISYDLLCRNTNRAVKIYEGGNLVNDI